MSAFEIVNQEYKEVLKNLHESLEKNGGQDGRTDSYGYRCQKEVLEKIIDKLWEEGKK